MNSTSNAVPTAGRPVSVIMLAYGEEDYLGEAVAAVLGSQGVLIDLIIVDNGCTSSAIRNLPVDARVHVVTPTRNLGFAGGVNYAVQHAGASVLAFVNSDAVVDPGALAALVCALDEPGVGMVSGCVRLADKPDRVNSVGNPIHVLGLSWAGGMNDPVSDHRRATDIASATGALLAVRTALWRELGGFPDEFFAYCEDLEVSWRCWQRGLRVRYVPDAMADHHYEFSRSPLKMYLVERNRLLFVLTAYGPRLLLLMALPLMAFDAAITAIAWREGWVRQKVRGWRWILGHGAWIRRRRAIVQGSRTVSDRDLAHLLTATFDPAQFPLPMGGTVLQALMRGWWSAARRLL